MNSFGDTDFGEREGQRGRETQILALGRVPWAQDAEGALLV
jgi:hypothetical protein